MNIKSTNILGFNRLKYQKVKKGLIAKDRKIHIELFTDIFFRW